MVAKLLPLCSLPHLVASGICGTDCAEGEADRMSISQSNTGHGSRAGKAALVSASADQYSSGVNGGKETSLGENRKK